MLFDSKESALQYAELIPEGNEKTELLAEINKFPLIFDPAKALLDDLELPELLQTARETEILSISDPKNKKAKEDATKALTKVKDKIKQLLMPIAVSIVPNSEIARFMQNAREFQKQLIMSGISKSYRFYFDCYLSTLFSNKGGARLVLDKESGIPVLQYIVDTLGVSCNAQELTYTDVTDEPPLLFEDFYGKLLGELFTHSAKHNHSSAKLIGRFVPTPARTGYLNGPELGPAILSGAKAGGKLIEATWLLDVLQITFKLPNLDPFSISDCLTSAELREKLKTEGISVFEEVPLIKPAEPKFNANLVPVIQMKVTPEESVKLFIIPSNTLLAAGDNLTKTITKIQGAKRKALANEGCTLFSEKLGVPCTPEPFQEYYLGFKSNRRETLLKEINKQLKEHGLPPSVTAEFIKENLPNSPYSKLGTPVPIVASNEQNVSDVYAKTSKKGIPRFKSYLLDATPTTRVTHDFYALPRLLKNKLDYLIKTAPEAAVDLVDKYKIGTRWLPARVQRQIAEPSIQAQANRFVNVVKELTSSADWSKVTPPPTEGKLFAIQLYALGAESCSETVLAELAKQATVLLRSSSQTDMDHFTEVVLQHLTGAQA